MGRLALPLSETDHLMLREIRSGLAAQIGRTSLVTAVRYALRCAVMQMRAQGLLAGASTDSPDAHLAAGGADPPAPLSPPAPGDPR